MGNQINVKAKFVNLLKQEDENALAEELKSILLLDISQEDYLNAFYPSDIRDILKQSPKRISGIIHYLHHFLCDSQTDLASHVQYRQWKNSLRILTSIIPVLYEEQFKEQMKEMLWNTKIPKPNEEIQERDPPLIISLLQRLFQMCFHFGFTIDSLEYNESVVKNDTLLQQFAQYYQNVWNSYKLQVGYIWKGFNPQCKYPNDIAKYFENRYLVLSCIFALVSSTLFSSQLFFEQEIQLLNEDNKQENQEKVNQPPEQEIDEQFQEQQIQEQQNQNNNHNNQPKTQKFLVQTPNAALFILQKVQFFPELFVSIIGFSIFPTERIKQFLRGLVNLPNQIEDNLQNVCLKLLTLIIGGQGFVQKEVLPLEKEFEEMIRAKEHFQLFNIPFPQFINLPQQIQEGIIVQLTQKFYSYYKSQQQFIRGTFEKHLSNFESCFIQLSYLSAKSIHNVPNIMVVFLLSYFNQNKYIKKVSLRILKLLSAQPQLNKQLCASQEFTLTFTDAPIIIGSWGDLLITALCDTIQKDFYSIKESKLLEISQIIFNVSAEIGNLNRESCEMICNLIKKLANYDFILKSPNVLISVQNLIGAVSQIVYFFPDDNFNLICNVIKIKDSIKFIHQLQITQKKLQFWWGKYAPHNPIVNQSFIKSQQFQNDVHDIRESQVRSITQQQQATTQKKQSKQFQQEEIQSLQQLEQIQSDRTQRPSAEQTKYFELWKNFNQDQLKQFVPLASLAKLLEKLFELCVDPTDEALLKGVCESHDLRSLMIKQLSFKITVDKFKIFKMLTKQIWSNCLRNSDKFPYFEKSQCPCFQLSYVEK
ncbi:unnamed protein product (macronuclear) [Paramecium tetraurelia]|uniref:Uncharacterized protein n=1 Tax=Paramecium tetraurelia TaxID=5888 RepID=A0DBA5_PARTE|nr:uncharacterized protein GSPATT00015216001 [Paramecium tetraurelia]CAK80322.1 unnamed protein product [Paramecium tetraurelia]|eukprot:XP_001447719.1 hypothetical protein (macronuclear) [Paramecium tetraurelia strain d4-2]